MNHSEREDGAGLSDERLANIRRYLDGKSAAMDALSRQCGLSVEDIERTRLHYFALQLLADNDRLRAELQSAHGILQHDFMAMKIRRKQLAAALEIVRAVYDKEWVITGRYYPATNGKPKWVCHFCKMKAGDFASIEHTPDCVMTRARAVLVSADGEQTGADGGKE